jgi:RimJ/RimL family protein N-acetyltransferase
MKTPSPCTLRGRLVELAPLSHGHASELFAALSEDPAIWQWLVDPPPASLDDLQEALAAHLRWQEAGGVVAFAQVHAQTGRAVGVTNYLAISVDDCSLEIGGTWLGRSSQRTGLNQEAKYLLLRHAFDELGASRVQLKTDARNEVSQRAIAGIGAVREGVLRKHMRCWDGFLRDTVMFSIIDAEWPAVRRQLEARLGAAPPGGGLLPAG